jgi:iron complex outermembrane receptor protein
MDVSRPFKVKLFLLLVALVLSANVEKIVGDESPDADLSPTTRQRIASLFRTSLVQPEDESELDDLDLSALSELEGLLSEPVLVPALEQEVTSVTRQASTVGRSAAAVYVVTQDMIRRSGATSVPEILRMVPGLQVARIDSNKWAISSRGFNNRFANKLLVMIDGRIVYTPLFSGVYWEVQDMVLQDIERIEVIRGPGATVWGANAVNGVINIITKTARDTQGALVAAGGGNQDKTITAARYGGKVGDNFYYRVYGKHFERARSFNPTAAHDDWRMGRAGFRAEWYPNGCDCDTITFQGEMFTSQLGNSLVNAVPTPPFTEFVINDIEHAGGFLSSRWVHRINEDSFTALQVYFDRTDRDDLQVDQLTDIYDIDFQHHFPLGCRNAITWGLRYRNVRDNVGTNNAFTFQVVPVNRTTELFSGWVQDEISLVGDELMLTVGSKFEHNDYTGFEMQPSARMLWAPNNRQVVWGAISRAVRTPSRIEENLRFRSPTANPNVFSLILGNPQVAAEDVITYEIGYRAQPTDTFSWDLALFYNDYEDLISFHQVGPAGGIPVDVPLQYANIADAETYGIEVSCQWDITQCWHLRAWYSFLQIQSHGSANEALEEERSPHNQAFLMSSWDLPHALELDVLARYVDELPNVNTPSYISMDARLGWRPNDCWEFSVVGQNLLNSHHVEFAPSLVQTTPTQVNRGIYAQVVWQH